jgi:16S rRNA C967 or C1407 C5-methylase (RsmB/RsmF family)
VVTNDEKSWSLDFLLYVIKRRPELDVKLFDQRDWQEAIKFVRNKVYTALFGKLHTSDLFDEDDVRLWRVYDAFSRRIRFRQGCYVLEHSGKEYRLPVNHFEYPVFFHKHGLSEVPQQVLAQVRGKDVIDGGAYIGDSVLVLEELEPRAIYAFEPLEENFELLKETIRINGLRNVVPLKMGLGTAKGVMSVTPFGSASFRSDIFGGGPGERERRPRQ